MRSLLALLLALSVLGAKYPCVPESLKVGEVRAKVPAYLIHCFRCREGVIRVDRASRLGPVVVRCVTPAEAFRF